MIRQGIVNDSILEKKFKILRTSIMLGNFKNKQETLTAYEEVAKEIDKIRRNIYEELLASKMYITTSLEEEKARLEDLIDFTSNGIKNRNDFIDDYIKVTANFLDDLPRVSNEEDLSNYKLRLKNINEYLHNCDEIKNLNSKLTGKRQELENKYESKANSDVINSKLEDELIEEFNKVILRDDYYSGLNYTDIDSELAKIGANLKDKKEVMDTFVSSYEALKSAGISGAEREEYLSYVVDAKKDYYNELEKKFVLSIYKLILDKESNYEMLFQKRVLIDNILRERLKTRNELEITSNDEMEYFTNICNEQFSIIKSQKLNMENIDKLILEIADCESRLEELNAANNRSEIVSLLNEFSEKKPEIEKNDESSLTDNLSVDVASDNGYVVLENYVPKSSNMVVKISDPLKINVKTASDTAKLVMKKVVIVLEPKKFNTKRNKLKEAEIEINEMKKKEKKLRKNNKEEIESPILEVTEDTKPKKEVRKSAIVADGPFMTLDSSDATDDVSDDVFVDGNVSISLNTQEVKKGVKNTLTMDEFKFDTENGNNLNVPTEIFVEETREKPAGLFSQTDPFLDDNQFEVEDSRRERVASNMPKIGIIGSVRPTSILSKIEEKVVENTDIILPTMGLSNSEQINVPIVSENYIN